MCMCLLSCLLLPAASAPWPLACYCPPLNGAERSKGSEQALRFQRGSVKAYLLFDHVMVQVFPHKHLIKLASTCVCQCTCAYSRCTHSRMFMCVYCSCGRFGVENSLGFFSLTARLVRGAHLRPSATLVVCCWVIWFETFAP